MRRALKILPSPSLMYYTVMMIYTITHKLFIQWCKYSIIISDSKKILIRELWWLGTRRPASLSWGRCSRGTAWTWSRSRPCLSPAGHFSLPAETRQPGDNTNFSVVCQIHCPRPRVNHLYFRLWYNHEDNSFSTKKVYKGHPKYVNCVAFQVNLPPYIR